MCAEFVSVSIGLGLSNIHNSMEYLALLSLDVAYHVQNWIIKTIRVVYQYTLSIRLD